MGERAWDCGEYLGKRSRGIARGGDASIASLVDEDSVQRLEPDVGGDDEQQKSSGDDAGFVSAGTRE